MTGFGYYEEDEMNWINVNASIPNDENFHRIIKGLVFECPSSYRKKVPPRFVSARNCSFKQRGIEKGYLKTLLAQMVGSLKRNRTYIKCNSSDDLIDVVERVIHDSHLQDEYFELIVFRTSEDMPDTEAIYFYIRNAFAHGAFEVIDDNGEKVYLLENRRGEKVYAQMRLKEKTLLKYVELANLDVKGIAALQGRKKR